MLTCASRRLIQGRSRDYFSSTRYYLHCFASYSSRSVPVSLSKVTNKVNIILETACSRLGNSKVAPFSFSTEQSRYSYYQTPNWSYNPQTSPSNGIFKKNFSTQPDAKQTAEETALVDNYFKGLMANDRAVLARAITLVESSKREHKRIAQQLLSKVLDVLKERKTLAKANHYKLYPGHKLPMAFKIGLSGPPGAGKSTFIESLGCFLTSKGYKVAVLAVDPSSTRTGGSILGDKTRMIELSKSPLAYVRPSPSRGSLGGVARNTSEAISLCEGAGYEVILIETVGVGQSEIAVANMVDMFTLLVPPAAGDELQGIKKGIVELADLVIVNKADGELLTPARKAKTEYTSALKLLQPRHPLWHPEVTMLSSLENTGLDETWNIMLKYYNIMLKSGELYNIQSNQRKVLMWKHVSEEIMDRFREHPKIAEIIDTVENQVSEGVLSPGMAADLLVNQYESKA